MAAGVTGEGVVAAVTAKATAAVLATLVVISRRRLIAMRERLLRSGVTVPDVDAALAHESDREKVYQRRAAARVRAGMKLALASSDASTRAAATESVLRREQRFAQQRSSAAAERVLAAAELEELRRTSPQGAFWRLGARRKHTPDCLAMAGHFWPWSVLNKVHPLLHVGCGCYLISLGQALKEGLMAPGDIPTDAAATKLASPVIAHVEAEAAENRKLYGLEEQAERELVVRESLIGIADANMLACSPLRCDAALEEDVTGYITKDGRHVHSYKRLDDLLRAHEPNVEASVAPRSADGALTVGMIRTKGDGRGAGHASQFLAELTHYADQQGKTIALTAEPPERGGLSKAQLIKWYMRHGFVKNQGRNKDYAFTETMLRPPQ